MKMTVELPDDLLRAIKVRAAEKNGHLKDELADLLRLALEHEARAAPAPRHVKLPLSRGNPLFSSGEEMTPERVAEILLAQEAEEAVRLGGRG